jgi:hypothetical protein
MNIYGASLSKKQYKIKLKEENGIGLDTHYAKKQGQYRKLH